MSHYHILSVDPKLVKWLTCLDCFQPYEEVSEKDIARFKQEMEEYQRQQSGQS